MKAEAGGFGWILAGFGLISDNRGAADFAPQGQTIRNSISSGKLAFSLSGL